MLPQTFTGVEMLRPLDDRMSEDGLFEGLTRAPSESRR